MASLFELANHAAIIFITNKNHILLVRERISKEWMTPGGHRDGNESEFECALREFREETSFSIDPENIKSITSHVILHKNGKKTKIYIIHSNQEFHFYNPNIVHNRETDKLYYLDLDDLKTLLKTGLYQEKKIKIKSYNILSFNELIRLGKI
jgi:8-oxo-dGTP pyrophosphatase MutT (NUDIX family)